MSQPTPYQQLALSSRVRLALAAVLAVVVFVRAWQLADPPEPLRISEETTLITEPLAADGYPDYVAALLERMGRGTPPSQNAAVEVWRAIGSGEVDPEYREALFAEIGCPVPPEEGLLEDFRGDALRNEIADWLDEENKGAFDRELLLEQADKLLDTLTRRPLPVDCPPLQAWFDRNREGLDLLVEASHKPAYYSPPPNLLTNPPDQLYAALLTDKFGLRDAAQPIASRASIRLDQDTTSGAIEGTYALLLHGDQLMQQPLLVTNLLGVSIRQYAFNFANILVDGCDDAEVLEALSNVVRASGVPDFAKRALAFGEPAALLDEVSGVLLRHRPSVDELLTQQLRALDELGIEPNVVFGNVRSWLKHLESAASCPDRVRRKELAERRDEELDSMMDQFGTRSGILALISRKKRSEVAARTVIVLLSPVVRVITTAEDETYTRQQLTLLAAALKLHRVEHGAYPATLDALDPELLESLPTDPFTNRPFRYQRRGEGFALWSLGPNGIDDGGTDARGHFVDGEHAPVDWYNEREPRDGADDLVVRLPIPPIELPDPR